MSGSQHWIDAGDENLFGTHWQYEEELSPLAMTTAAFVDFVTLVTPVIPAGEYRIACVFQYEASNAASTGEMRIRLDNATVLDLEELRVASADERKTYANFKQVMLTAGAHQFDLETSQSQGPGTFTFDDGKLELWRVA